MSRRASLPAVYPLGYSRAVGQSAGRHDSHIQEIGIAELKTVAIDLKRCDASPFCPVKRICPSGAVSAVPGGYTVDASKCTGCGACIRVCPMGAAQFS
ncbi:MAG: 4Fe-4S binding protein [Coriobacteriia bacterium]|nr:4Fe-4S binding protein [Coriobacteriia bacterium]